ncbi:MAG: YdbH domain-containing protein [Alphaproteobacteria bacterium]|nr:YdbH domain-containing protein [Alphaproteobacteria bacterium]
MTFWRRFGLILGAILFALLLALVLAWLARARLAGQVAQAYFRDHGIRSDVEIHALGFSGVSGSFALGPADAPDVSARRIEVQFDPLRWIPRVVAVRLVDPVVRARVDAKGHVSLGSLQAWLDSLPKSSGQSDYVAKDLSISLSGLRAILDTPAGPLEVDGDLKVTEGLPVTAALTARPASISYMGHHLRLRAARLTYDSKSGHIAAHLEGDLNDAAVKARQVVADLDATGFRWELPDGASVVRVGKVHLKAAAADVDAGTHLSQPVLDMTLSNVSTEYGDAGFRFDGDVAAAGGADPVLAVPDTGDTALTRAVARNLKHLDVAFAGHLHHDSGRTHLVMSAPVTVRGAGGADFTVSALTLDGVMPDAVQARFEAALRGGGLPQVTAKDASLTWSGGRVTGALRLAAAFDYAMLRGARLSGAGDVSWDDGAWAFTMKGCAPVRLAQFRPAKVMARAISTTLCPVPSKPLLSGDAGKWRLVASARNAVADLTLAGVQLNDGSAGLDFSGAPTRAMAGTVTVRGGRIRDQASPARFLPVAASGRLALKAGVWRGTLAVTGKDGAALGDVAITHDMASGVGRAHIAAPAVSFDPDHLQPVDLTPMLAAFRQTKGTAGFDGDVTWNAQGIDSGGTLTIDGLNFLTPLGTAHAIKTKIVFTSLLPPQTAPDQSLTISRIDWTLPFSTVDLKFGFNSQAIAVDSIKAGFAEGQAALGSFTIKTADPTRIQGAIDVNGITLSSLIAASNLGSRINLDGKVSGHIPFTTGPEGIRIAKGRLSADGPGRLSINHNLWTQGAAATNAVQDFAYQALEHLAFDSMSAELNSVPGGRLQIVFHIKGHSDPPKAQTAEVPLSDILDGSALQRSIPLPSGTPIDLTLDTSLNFDELLKSYAEAWSKTLNPAQARSTTP